MPTCPSEGRCDHPGFKSPLGFFDASWSEKRRKRLRAEQTSISLWTTGKRVGFLKSWFVMPKAMNIEEHVKAPRFLEQIECLEPELTETPEAADGRLQRTPKWEDSCATRGGGASWAPVIAVGRLPAAHEGRNHLPSGSEWNRSQTRFLGFDAGFRRPGARRR